MKLQLLLVVALAALLLADLGAAEKVRKHRKGRKHRLTTTTTEQPAEAAAEAAVEAAVAAQAEQDVMTILAEDEKEEEKEAEHKAEEEDAKMNEIVPQDPCQDKFCGAGKVCQVSSAGEAECVCIPSCPIEVDPRRKVCSNHNETWGSDCEIYQMRCMCDHGSEMCKGEKYKHVHIEYYGVCREMRECSQEEMSDFPRRMRDWLFNVMRDLADREELSPYFLKLEREAETNLTRRWTNAAIWKWCDLDGHPADRSVSRHELFPIRAPLMALEHCIAPFLNKCDADNDHLITLKEWGKCLELEEEDIEEKCDEVRGEEE
ncbi:SPARC protein [Frankliniella fusca]|uniref:SPARC protein n=2 Tax=Arthropoda TaxID=6656 RepID=A0AAE1H819_9NEOP|nr:SPARC protein [Frankliniella fusca]